MAVFQQSDEAVAAGEGNPVAQKSRFWWQRPASLAALLLAGGLLLFLLLLMVYNNPLSISASNADSSSMAAVELAVQSLAEQDLPLRYYQSSEAARKSDLFVEAVPTGFLELNTPESLIFALDPFFLYIDNRVPAALMVLAETGSLQDFLARLPALSADFVLPLGVAGNDDHSFLSFLLSLAAEILPPADFGNLVGDLLSSSDEIPAAMQPVLDFVRYLMRSGVLADNWTNWDTIALNDAVTSRQLATVFAPASFYKNLSQNQSFHLVQKRLPSGQGRRTYMIAGTAIQLRSGSRRGAEKLADVGTMLQANEFQRLLAQSSQLSPVNGNSPFIDLNHRNLLTWLENADYYMSITASAISPSLLSALRIALR